MIYESAENEGFTTVAPTLGVRPGCSQCCTPSYMCLSIYGWGQMLLMSLEAEGAEGEADGLVELSGKAAGA